MGACHASCCAYINVSNVQAYLLLCDVALVFRPGLKHKAQSKLATPLGSLPATLRAYVEEALSVPRQRSKLQDDEEEEDEEIEDEEELTNKRRKKSKQAESDEEKHQPSKKAKKAKGKKADDHEEEARAKKSKKATKTRTREEDEPEIILEEENKGMLVIYLCLKA